MRYRTVIQVHCNTVVNKQTSTTRKFYVSPEEHINNAFHGEYIFAPVPIVFVKLWRPVCTKAIPDTCKIMLVNVHISSRLNCVPLKQYVDSNSRIYRTTNNC